jgi:hypothetical protein
MAFQQNWIRSALVALQTRITEWNSKRLEEDLASRLERERIRAILLNVPRSLPDLTRRPGPFGPGRSTPERLPD